MFPMRKWNREYRYVIAIGIVAFIFLCLAILIQSFKTTNCLATWLFNFLSQWAMVLAASATVLLAAAAFWAIMDNRHSRLKDSKKHSLDQICSWAQDAFRVLSRPGEYLVLDAAERFEMRMDLTPIYARSIVTIADANEFGGDLKTKVDSASTRLNAFIEYLGPKRPESVNLSDEWEQLKNAFLDVIGVASELRAKFTLEKF